MSSIHLRFKSFATDMSGVPVFAEVIGEDFETVARGIIRVNGSHKFPVSPGRYLVRISLPSGQTLTATSKVGLDETTTVTVEDKSTQQEWLEYPRLLGHWDQESDPSRTILDTRTTRSGAVVAGSKRKHRSKFSRSWLRLWRSVKGVWEISTLACTFVGADQNAKKYTMRLPQLDRRSPDHPLYCLQVGGGKVACRFIAIPPSNTPIEVLVRESNSRDEPYGDLSVEIFARGSMAEALLSYLMSGGLEPARSLGERLLRDKMRDPLSAAVGGYYLLRVREYRHLHDWPRNLADFFPWLPDGAIVHAWQLIRDPAVSNPELARERLLEAVNRGLPVYTEGLRMLVDGLQLFKEDARAGQKNDEEVTVALSRIRRFARAADWSQSLTTFYGSDPEQPSVKRRFLVPRNADRLTWMG